MPGILKSALRKFAGLKTRKKLIVSLFGLIALCCASLIGCTAVDSTLPTATPIAELADTDAEQPPTATPTPPEPPPTQPPPAATQPPPTNTPVPPTDTPIPPTETPLPPPTNTPLPPPTNTPLPPPTNTPLPPPTSTPPPPPTNTPLPPPTSVPPTNTPLPPPTDTPPPPPPPTEPPPAAPGPVVIIGVNKGDEYVDIQNQGSVEVNLAGWTLVSEKGNQACGLGGTIGPGQVLRIWALREDADKGGYNCDNGSPIWNNSESDPAVLYDNTGAEVSRW